MDIGYILLYGFTWWIECLHEKKSFVKESPHLPPWKINTSAVGIFRLEQTEERVQNVSSRASVARKAQPLRLFKGQLPEYVICWVKK